MLQAVSAGHQDIAELLLANKAEINVGDKTSQTPLDFAAQGDDANDVKMAEFLLSKGADIRARDSDGNTPLLVAASAGNKNMTEFLLAQGADIEAKDKSGCTPLTWAAIQGHKDIAEVLLAHHADVNALSPCGQTPLNSAAMNGHKDVAELLLAHNADLHARAQDGQTPLDWAVDNGRMEMVVFLLAKGADINAKTNDGSTPLRLAEMHHNYDVATYLRQHGGQEPAGVVVPGTIPKTGDAATDPATLEAAARAGDLEKVKALIAANPNLVLNTGEFSSLLAAARSDHQDVAKFLLASHADINAKDYGATALCDAAQHGKKDMAEFLLAYKADPNIGDNSGFTPLFYAAQMGHADLVELLLAHHANVNGRGKDGPLCADGTPLYIAAANGSADVVKILLAHGADPKAKGNDGLTPLEIAVKNQHDRPAGSQNDVVSLLRPPHQEPATNVVAALPPGITSEMEQTFLAKYKAALERKDPDTYLALIAMDPALDAKTKEDMKGWELFSLALAISNPDRTYAFVPATPEARDNPYLLNGKMYGAYLPPVVALKITFATQANPAPGTAVGDTTLPLCLKDGQLMLVGPREIPGAVPPDEKAKNFGITPNQRKITTEADFDNSDNFTSLDEFLSDLKQPKVEILASGEGDFAYYAICRINPDLCVYADGNRRGKDSTASTIQLFDSNKVNIKGEPKFIHLLQPGIDGTVFKIPQGYRGPLKINAQYWYDTGTKSSSFSRTIDWK